MQFSGGRKGHRQIWLKHYSGFWFLPLLTRSKHCLSPKDVTSGNGDAFLGLMLVDGGTVSFPYRFS